ncbi:hypothetical protein MBAV_003750 [Candidatus Magnetobacterium bavaricum]|uniref:Uncharacterized protein n=1 Tax=Candidatus Magnetobacterium bavaricum TaxID=29290 RepID=A0A0F3GQ17_9BACT|nr:hypothetical protein MBAV_003750 [Candidatus Magnetobacterium bavaricum]
MIACDTKNKEGYGPLLDLPRKGTSPLDPVKMPHNLVFNPIEICYIQTILTS